jgi:hypothetical protein
MINELSSDFDIEFIKTRCIKELIMYFIARFIQSGVKSNIRKNIIELLQVIDQNNIQIRVLKQIKEAFESKNINNVKKNNPVDFKSIIYNECIRKIDEMFAYDKRKHPNNPISNEAIDDYKYFCKYQSGLAARINSLEKKLNENKEKLKIEESKL